VSEEDLTLAEGSVLVHIGPYKTGSTAIQSSLHQHRDDLARHGVLYPGPTARQFRAGWALIGRGPRGKNQVPEHEWDDLVTVVRESTATRVCLSTENFASATTEQVRRLVDDLGPDKVHAVAVVRRLDRLLPSSWQQRLQMTARPQSYEEWLREVLAVEPRRGPGQTFWHHHGVGQLLERWRASLPAEQITLVVADESDRSQQMRVFERLLGLPDGLLTPGARDNVSFTYERIELYRRVLDLCAENGWSARHRRMLLQRGLLRGLRQAPAHETDLPIPSLPGWAAERVAALSDARVEEVVASGARIIGDPEALRVREVGAGDLAPPPETIAIETVARGVEALVEAALEAERVARRNARRAGPAPARRRTVAETRSTELVREVAGRVRRRLLRR